jgi:hypothetical protein
MFSHFATKFLSTVECIRHPAENSVLGTGVRGSGVPRNFVRGEGGSANSVEDRGLKERGSGGGSPLVRGSTQFANE